MNAAICGVGVVGGFGRGLSALETALSGGRANPTPVDIPTREGILQVPCLSANTEPLTQYVPAPKLRRMSHYIRLGLLAAFDAMAMADVLDKDRRGRMGVIVASSHGPTGNNYAFQYPFEDKEEICGSPTRFSNSVHNAAAAYISMALEEMGPNHSITHDDLSFPSALLTAAAWLGQQRVDTVLVGGMDELSHAHAYAWNVRQTAGKQSPMAGEGACFFVLKPAAAASSDYGIIRQVVLGRCNGTPVRPPAGDWVILDNSGSAPAADAYGAWLPDGTRTRTYAAVYGDLSVDSAFDTAIAALSRKEGRIFPDLCTAGDAIEPLNGASIVCLKRGVGGTYAWTLLD